MSLCVGCDTPLPLEPRRPGRRRKWCSDRCRKGQYAGECVDCGAPTNGHDGPGKASTRCAPCRHAKETAEAVWTRERMIAEGHRFHALTGRWPVTGDFNRYQNRGQRRVLIDEFHRLTGPWPHVQIVQNVFGTWRAYIEALGGEAQPRHDGGRGMSKSARTAELRALVEALS
jgi:hypothetical protein